MRNGRLRWFVGLVGVTHAFVVVAVLQRHHDELRLAHGAVPLDPTAHWLRDAVLYAPAGALVLLLATLLARRLTTGWDDGFRACLAWAGIGALAYAAVSVPAAHVHATWFAEAHAAQPTLLASVEEAVLTLRYSFALLLAVAMLFGLPWAPRRPARSRRPASSTLRREPC